jgi:tetratricopeptide (TPR) repeat protein
MQETLEESVSMYKECLVLAREIGDQWAAGHALLSLGMISLRAGDYQGAEENCQEALAQQKHNRDSGGISFALGLLSMLAVDRGRYQEAVSLAQESISVASQYPTAACWLARALYAAGMYAQAQEMFQQILELSKETDDRPLISQILFYLGEIAIQMGDYALAEKRIQESLVLSVISDPWWGITVRNHDALSRLDLAQGEYLQARGHLQDALKIVIQLDYLPILLAIMTTAAELFAEESDLVYAALLAAFVKDHPASQVKVKERAEQLLTCLAAKLFDEKLAKIHQRSRESNIDTLTAQLVIDLEIN